MSCSRVPPWITRQETEGVGGIEFQRTCVCLNKFPAPVMSRGGRASKRGGIDGEFMFGCIFFVSVFLCVLYSVGAHRLCSCLATDLWTVFQIPNPTWVRRRRVAGYLITRPQNNFLKKQTDHKWTQKSHKKDKISAKRHRMTTETHQKKKNQGTTNDSERDTKQPQRDAKGQQSNHHRNYQNNTIKPKKQPQKK